MKSLIELNLSDNPFEMITPSPNGDFVWAGMTVQKNKITNAYEQSFLVNSRQLILNWGPIGGGKTFAAYFFKSNVPFQNPQRKVINVYVRTPKEGSNAFSQLFKDFIDSYSMSVIRNDIQEKIARVGKDNLEAILKESNISEEFAKAIIKIGDTDETTQRIISSYFYGIATSAEIKKIGLFRPIKTEPDYVKLLAGIIILLTNATIQQTRLFFWIDEMEDMVYYNSKQFKQFSQSIRDLVDTINQKFTLFLNFTLSEGEDETVKTLLGEALWSRKNYDIRFKDFKISDGVEYCKDLISHYQIDKSTMYFPFELAAIEMILNTLPTALLTPREINKKMNGLLMFARENEKTQISPQVVSEYENSLISEQ